MTKFILIVFVLFSVSCFSQSELPLKPLVEKPFIEVTGTAEKEVVPDKIFISITLSDKIVATQKYSIEEQESKLKQALAKINIPLSNLSLSNASSEITKYKQKETGFKVSKDFTLQVKNAGEVADVFKELYAINIREAKITRTENTKIDSLRKEVRIAAVKAAKDKAEYLLAAVGEQIDKPLEIHEQNNYAFFENSLLSNTTNTSNRQMDSPTEPQDATDFQKFTIKFSYYIKYAIK